MEHLGIFINNNINKKTLITALLNGQILDSLVGKKIEIFSDIRLLELIDFENKFGRTDLKLNTNPSLISLSAGEQKKALLQHCLLQNPDYLILDNPFDNLDIASQTHLKIELKQIAQKISLIQLVNRKVDLLDFISEKAFINDKNEFQFIEANSGNEYLENAENENEFYRKFPEPSQNILYKKNEIFSFENVNVKYNEKPILDQITWHVKKGDYWQLKGPNGSGKTTILSMIIGDNPKAFGQEISIFGNKKGTGESVWELKKRIGYFTPSMISLFARNTSLLHMVVSGIFDSIGLYSMPTERQLRLANEWLNLINLQHLATKPFHQLTIGQQRIAMIARAMIKHPPLLILDEPTAALDDHNALIISKLINKIAAESSTTIIYVSHRKEPGLSPKFVFELTPSRAGSTGKIVLA